MSCEDDRTQPCNHPGPPCEPLPVEEVLHGVADTLANVLHRLAEAETLLADDLINPTSLTYWQAAASKRMQIAVPAIRAAVDLADRDNR